MKGDGYSTKHNPSHVVGAPSDLITTISFPVDSCPAAVYLAQLKQSSRRPEKQALDLVASLLTSGSADCLMLNWGAIRYQHTAAVRARLLDRYAPATVNRILSALRGVLEQAWLLGQISAEDYHRAARLSPVIGETLPAGRELLAEEIASLIQNCIEDRSPIGTRDAAIISILFGAGLRREEITKLNMEDYHSEDAKLVIRGKRSKQRIAYLGNGALAALIKCWKSVGRTRVRFSFPRKEAELCVMDTGSHRNPSTIYSKFELRGLA